MLGIFWIRKLDSICFNVGETNWAIPRIIKISIKITMTVSLFKSYKCEHCKFLNTKFAYKWLFQNSFQSWEILKNLMQEKVKYCNSRKQLIQWIFMLFYKWCYWCRWYFNFSDPQCERSWKPLKMDLEMPTYGIVKVRSI